MMNRHPLPNRRPQVSFEIEHGAGRRNRFTVSIWSLPSRLTVFGWYFLLVGAVAAYGVWRML